MRWFEQICSGYISYFIKIILRAIKMNSVYKKYNISVILPTYCECDNIPIMIWMLMKTADEA